MPLFLVTAPAAEPVDLATAKAHLRVDIPDDDALITSLIATARQHAEAITRRALITQTWDLVLDAWPDDDRIDIPLPPLQSVTSITYKDSAGAAYTVPATDYIVDTVSSPGRVVLGYGKTWPSTALYPAGAITVRFTAGYGDATAVPEAIKAAIKLLVAHFYENREPVVIGKAMNDLPLTIEALLWPFRVLRWF